ncbi:probetacellulin [Melanotaenia boesemani]|uniref:probetacellulin n=1 Tax=Melanotaenia boesemani TaxID=1250792 RepID=UPI001C05D77F|nr:probetacellulin [Melanotaenia boesemani]XP_041826195.1 probetacellulin [Melanotaenia boesemani]
MAKVNRLYIGALTVLALCKYCLAEWNSTDKSANRTVSQCHLHGDRDNCTDTEETGQWNGHFSECPEDLTYYCVHGECRYIKEQETPSCRCQSGYTGSRCEYVDLDWLIGERRQIIIACVIAGLVFLVIVIVFICICSNRRCRRFWQRRTRREEPRNGTEKLSMMVTSGTHTPLTADLNETTHTNSV